MDMPTETTGPDAYLPRSAYSIARVAADPKTVGLEKDLETVHGSMKAAIRERDDNRELVQKKAAQFDMADGVLDDELRNFELMLLAAVKKNRDHVKYKRYFPDGLRAVTEAHARDEEPEIVNDMLQAMVDDENDPDIGEVVKQCKPKLEASRAQVIAADEALGLAEKAFQYIEDKKLPALMATWREEYKKLEGALLTHYPNDSKRVDRFFKSFRKNPKPRKP